MTPLQRATGHVHEALDDLSVAVVPQSDQSIADEARSHLIKAANLLSLLTANGERL